METTTFKSSKYLKAIFDQLYSFWQRTKINFQCFKVTHPYSLGFNIYIDDSRASELINYINEFWPTPKRGKAVKKINIIISNHQFLAKYILFIVKYMKLFSKSYEKFVLHQKILVLQSKEITVFCPVGDFSSYPTLIKFNNNFIVTNYEINSINKQFIFGLYREIFTSYFETKRWITYHANGVLLPNNTVAIIVGNPKAGKSTLSVGLCTKGKSTYMCDDRIMLRKLTTLFVPTSTYIDIRTITQLGIRQPPLSSFGHTHLEMSIQLFRKKKLLSRNFPVGIILIPNFISKMGNKHNLIEIEEKEAYSLLIENCLTFKEKWRDSLMFNRYPHHDMMLSACKLQTELIASELKLIKIEFGPLANYSLIENQILRELDQHP